jgi:hypothetical protein
LIINIVSLVIGIGLLFIGTFLEITYAPFLINLLI